MDPLFPALPENLSALDRAELDALEQEHLSAQQLIRANDDEFLSGLNALQIIEQAEVGQNQLRQIRDAQTVLAQSEEHFSNRIAELTSEAAEPEAEEDEEDDPVVASAEETAPKPEPEPEPDDGNGGDTVTASAEIQLRRPPAPARERQAVIPEPTGPRAAVLTASVQSDGVRVGQELDRILLAKMVRDTARRIGRPVHVAGGGEERFMLASATFDFPEERKLTNDIEANTEKIRMLRNTEQDFLYASGGLCAPLTPIYTIPQFATTREPVWNSLPTFQADRGGISAPVPTLLATAEGAITIITADADELGGTFATKACLDQDCLDYVDTTVTIISHCREYGNLNARAWPESIAFENELTMAQLSRTSEGYILRRIKDLSLEVNDTSNTYSTVYSIAAVVLKAKNSIQFNLRANDMTFRALIPSWLVDNMLLDVVATQFDRFKSREQLSAILRGWGIEPTYYIDDLHPSSGVAQGFSPEVDNTTIDPFPTVAQIAMYPEGAFIGVDGGVLELGLVRDSTLNATNDFQFFGERFRNVARLAPEQATRWINVTVCPSGEFPALTGALTC